MILNWKKSSLTFTNTRKIFHHYYENIYYLSVLEKVVSQMLIDGSRERCRSTGHSDKICNVMVWVDRYGHGAPKKNTCEMTRCKYT